MEKIKVVFIQDWLVCGGAEQALYDLVCLLDKERFDVTVFVLNDGGEWDQRFRDAGIRVVYDFSCRKPTLNPIAKLGNFRKKMQVKHSREQEGSGLLDICCPGTDIVVPYSAWECDESGFAKGAKSVRYIHGDIQSNLEFRDIVMKRKDQMLRYDRIVCVSTPAFEAFRSIMGRSEGVELHYNPINSEEVKRKAQMPVDLPQDVPLICAVGRLSAEKGYERMLIIHKRLLEKGVHHKLVIVGDGPDRDFLPRLVRALDVEDSVILAGYQGNPYPYMNASKFLVSTSFTEGLPVTAMEAMCLGLPIVTPIPSVGETFGGEVCGLIVENNMESLEAGIQKMLTDEAFYAQAKAGAMSRSAWFDGRRMVREIEEMFLDLVKE